MPLAAENPADRVEQMIALTERLTELIIRETDLLSSRRPHEIQSFQDERSKLSALYAQEMALIRKDKSLISGAGEALLKTLKEKTQRFHQRLDDHGRVLRRVRTVTEGMIRAIAEDVAGQQQFQSGYGKNAGPRAPGTRPPATLALNQIV